MKVIYIDSLFLLNFILDYLLLLAAGRICALPLRRLRYALGAALGGAYAVAVVLPPLAFLTAAPVKLCAGAAMALIAYGGEGRLLRCILTFFAVSAAFGGAVWGASMLGGAAPGAGLYLPVDFKVLLLSFAVCYAVLTLIFHRAMHRTQQRICTAAIGFQGRLVTLPALEDTGNSLCDSLTGEQVLVAEAEALCPLFPAAGEVLRSLSDPMAALVALGEIPGLKGKFRLLPYSAIGVKQGLLLAFRPDTLTLDAQGARYLVALSPTPLSEDGSYRAIV